MKSCEAFESKSGLSSTQIQLQSTSGDALIEETYCPICAVIMSGVSERRVNRHIDECLRREQKREHEKGLSSPSKTFQFGAGTSSVPKKLVSGAHSQSKSKGPIKRKGASVESKSQAQRAKQPTQGSISAFFNR